MNRITLNNNIPVCLRRINHAVAASDGSQNAFLTFGAAHQKRLPHD